MLGHRNRPSAAAWGAGAAAAIAIALGMEARVAAQDRPRASVRLDYERSEDARACPDAAAVQASVVARLGYDPFVSDAPTTVRARIRRRGRALAAAVDLVREGAAVGTRTLESRKSDCDELAQAMSLAITLAIDPQAALAADPSIAPDIRPVPDAPRPGGTPAPGSAPDAGPTGVGGAPPVEPPSATPAPPPVTRSGAGPVGRRSGRLVPPPPRARARIEPFVAAGVGVGAGIAPAWTPGISVRGGAGLGRARMSLEGRWYAPQQTDGERARVQASLLEVGVLPCWRALRGEWLELCALGTLGSLRGEGDAISSPLSDATFFASAGGRAGVSVRVAGPIEASAYGELAAVLTPTDLEISQRVVWEGPSVRGGLGIQLGLHVR